jgi:hypothetical protein
LGFNKDDMILLGSSTWRGDAVEGS